MKTSSDDLFFRVGTVEWDGLHRYWDAWGARVQSSLVSAAAPCAPDRDIVRAWRGLGAWLWEQRQ